MKNCYQICPLTCLVFMLTDLMSCLTDWDVLVCISGIFSFYSYTPSCLVLTQVPTVGPFIFTAFINDICEAICSSSCLLFADDLKICHNIKNVVGDTVCSLLKCCLDNSVKFSTGETFLVSFTCKTNITDFKYKSHTNPMTPSMSMILQNC